jgi:hypothetical protein
VRVRWRLAPEGFAVPDLPTRPLPPTADPDTSGLTPDGTGGNTDGPDPSSAGSFGRRLEALAGDPDPAGPVPGYELLDEVGRGGMGVVYRARDLAFGRDVAVKLLQDRFSAGGVAARRFAEEARITGQLQHPGVPAAYQTGTLPDGRPFLAMKLIKGRNLDDLLKDRAGSPNLVAAFEKVCEAVGYAHAHGVIHRDLKPQNVMVGAFGEVQVMDWGLAKVLADRPGSADPTDPGATAGTEITPMREADDVTQAGSLLGTPAYMAPEQAIGAVDQVDARTDVFGLGGILCALLTGRPPYLGETAESTRQLAARAKQDEAVARLNASGADPDLVALCKRCLSPEKADRPADGGAVARAVADLRAAADDRARQAELDRVRADGERAKAAAEAAAGRRQRRLTVAAAAAVAAVFGAGAAVSGWLAVRATDARAEAVTEAANARAAEREAEARAVAERAAREDEARQRAEADRQRATATAVKDFFRDVLGQADADGQIARGDAPSPNLTVREALDRAAARLDDRFADQPLVEAEIRETVGTAYYRLGENIAAEAHKRRAADLYARALGPDSRRALAARLNLGQVYANRRKHRSAEELYEAVREAAEREYGVDDPLAVSARKYLGLVLARSGRDCRRGDEMAEQAIRDYRRLAGSHHRDTLDTLTQYGSLLGEQQRRLDRAEAVLAEAVAGWRATAGPRHPLTLYALEDLGYVMMQTGRLLEAEPILSEAVAGARAVNGDMHPYTIRCVTILSGLYTQLGRLEEAEPLLVQALAGRRQRLGPADPQTMMGVSELARVYLNLRRFDKAEPLLREVIGVLEGLGHLNFDYHFQRARLAHALDGQGKYAEAEALLLDAYAGMAKADVGLTAAYVRTCRGETARGLVELYTATGRPAEAARWRAKLPPGMTARLPLAPPPREVRQ